MKKISTLFKKNPDNLALVIDEVSLENEWVFTDKGVKATRKFDGTTAAIINGELYKRYDVKRGRQVPEGAIPCQEPDEITGHWPHWVKCGRNKPEDKFFWEAFDWMLRFGNKPEEFDGTYELCGPKVQGNPEKLEHHFLIKHGIEDLFMVLWITRPDGTKIYDFEYFKKILTEEDIEGIVFHHPDGRMCKIRKSDFGIKR